MNCEEARNLMMKHFDGELSDIEFTRLCRHTEMCEKCGAEFGALKEILGLMEESGTIDPPENFEESVMKKIHQWEALVKKRREMLVTILYSVFAVGIVLMSLLISYVSQNETLRALMDNMQALSGAVRSVINFSAKWYVFMSGIAHALIQTFITFAKTSFSVFALVTGILLLSYGLISRQNGKKEEGVG